MGSKYIQVCTTVPSIKDANKVANLLVNKKLVACVQIIGPVKSIFRWKNKIQKSKEWLCLAKTLNNKYSMVESEILKIHPYELPEIITFSVFEGNNAFLNWVDEEIK